MIWDSEAMRTGISGGYSGGTQGPASEETTSPPGLQGLDSCLSIASPGLTERTDCGAAAPRLLQVSHTWVPAGSTASAPASEQRAEPGWNLEVEGPLGTCSSLLPCVGVHNAPCLTIKCHFTAFGHFPPCKYLIWWLCGEEESGLRKDLYISGASLMAQMIKNPPAMWETWFQSLGWEDPLEEGMATYSSNLAWRIPMDRGVWQATVREVTKSHTWLSTRVIWPYASAETCWILARCGEDCEIHGIQERVRGPPRQSLHTGRGCLEQGGDLLRFTGAKAEPGAE